MEAILMKAASFIAVIILGYGLRKAGFFKEEDFYVLSKIVLKITLPASIIANFSQAEIQPAMLLLCRICRRRALHEPWMDPWRKRQG